MYSCFIIVEEFMLRIYFMMRGTMEENRRGMKVFIGTQFVAIMVSEVVLDSYICFGDHAIPSFASHIRTTIITVFLSIVNDYLTYANVKLLRKVLRDKTSSSRMLRLGIVVQMILAIRTLSSWV